MKLLPLEDYVIVRRSDAVKKTAGGLVLPDVAQDKPKQGVLLEVSEKAKTAGLAVGQTVIFLPYTGTEVELNHEQFLILEIKNIIAKVA